MCAATYVRSLETHNCNKQNNLRREAQQCERCVFFLEPNYYIAVYNFGARHGSTSPIYYLLDILFRENEIEATMSVSIQETSSANKEIFNSSNFSVSPDIRGR